MLCFLTSCINIPGTNLLNPANGLADELRRRLPQPCRALYVCSDPDNWEKTELYAGATLACFESAGFHLAQFHVLDGRNEAQASTLVRDAELVILTGGHVPTQNRFFHRIGLRALLADHPGVLVGISAGSMNAASLVYAQPELEGEALDPDYRRFLPGLGLTDTMLLPHYQMVKDDMLDGLRLFEDITYADSVGRCFCAIPDGSYLLAEGEREELHGEAYRIADGILTQIAGDGEAVSL